jgi:hypothetical protein
MREAAELMSEVSQGSTQQGLYDATAAFAWAQTEIPDLLRTLATVRATLLAAVDRLSSGGSASVGSRPEAGRVRQPGPTARSGSRARDNHCPGVSMVRSLRAVGSDQVKTRP